jgi:DNA-binding NarL/FixJ family response regulator
MQVPNPVPVLVVNTSPVLRSAASFLIGQSPAFTICAQVATPAEARGVLQVHNPQIAVLDPAQSDTPTLIKDLEHARKSVRIVAFSNCADVLSVHDALRAGALGYVSTEDPSESLVETLLKVLTGRRCVGPRVEDLLLRSLANGTLSIHGDTMSALSTREREVFRQCGGGLTNRRIAMALHVSEKTIETHIRRIREKLGIESLEELRREATQHFRVN